MAHGPQLETIRVASSVIPIKLCCRRVSKSYGSVSALSSLSFMCPSSGVVAILGANGAGKSTLLDSITGLTNIDEGEIVLGSSTLSTMRPSAIARLGIARTFQEIRLAWRMSALENVMAASNRLGILNRRSVRAKCMAMLNRVGLVKHANDIAEALSYGQQKLLAFVQALMTEPRILLLDEPVAGLTVESRSRVVEIFRARPDDQLILFVEHDLSFVRSVADRVLVLDRGTLILDALIEDFPTDFAV